MNSKLSPPVILTRQCILDHRNSFGAAVRTWRAHLGISQDELGFRADLHRTYISDIERGMRNPSLDTILKLARALEISMATLFSYEESTPPESTGNTATSSACAKEQTAETRKDHLHCEDSISRRESTASASVAGKLDFTFPRRRVLPQFKWDAKNGNEFVQHQTSKSLFTRPFHTQVFGE